MGTTKQTMRLTVAATAVAAAGLLGACSGSVEVGKTVSVSKEKLAEVVKQKLEAQQNAKADSMECAGDLPGEVGATQRCILTVGGDKLGVTVTTTSVEGDNVKFDAVVDDEVMK